MHFYEGLHDFLTFFWPLLTFFVHFRAIFDPMWAGAIWGIFGPFFWVSIQGHFRMVLALFWHRFGIILASFWGRFVAFLTLSGGFFLAFLRQKRVIWRGAKCIEIVKTLFE